MKHGKGYKMRVIFPITKTVGTNLIEYPDTKSLFSNIEIIGTDIIADYSGSLLLTEYTAVDESRREAKLKSLRDFFDTQYEVGLSEYSKVEQGTFSAQEEECEAFTKDNTTPTPRVDRLALARGIDRLVLLGKIRANINARLDAVGTQQALEDSIKACAVQADLDLITWQQT